MDILFNPNLAYILLVLGLVISILALVTPGTGFLELIALVMVSFAGWIISQLAFNWVALAILLLGLVPFLIALRVTNKWYYLVLSFLALSVGSTFLFVTEGWKPLVHPVLAVVINLLLVGFFWIVVRKGLDAMIKIPSHTLESLIGAIGETRTEVHREGSIFARGEMWSATSEHPIAIHKKVKILHRKGFILEVVEIIE